MHKKTRFFCAQVTGEQPAFQGVNSVPLTMSQRHDRMAIFLTLSVKKMWELLIDGVKGKAVKIALRRREHTVNAVGLRKSLTVDGGDKLEGVVKLSD
ncbi:TPA: hypothetical protein ACWP1V_003611 [Escherichia coli]